MRGSGTLHWSVGRRLFGKPCPTLPPRDAAFGVAAAHFNWSKTLSKDSPPAVKR